MTHCEGYRAAALVRAGDLASLGIDAEPHAPLPEGVLAAVALPTEADRLRRLAAERPDGPLGPAAVQRQGVRLQGVVPAHREVAGLRGGRHRPSAEPALCAPNSSFRARWSLAAAWVIYRCWTAQGALPATAVTRPARASAGPAARLGRSVVASCRTVRAERQFPALPRGLGN